MAIYHCSVKLIGRSSGRSSVAAAAYRAGEKIKNERDGVIHSYTKKSGIIYSEILLPERAPQEYKSRAVLWNAVEQAEKRKDAQTAREIEIALPIELTQSEQINILQKFTKDNFVNRGMIADVCIHDKSDGNPHAHIMLTTREITPDGFGGKERTWNDKELLNAWREQWAATCNRAFLGKNLSERIDHRTLQAQGIDREPTIHMGTIAHQIEQRGGQSERGAFNEELKERNMTFEKDTSELEQSILELKRKQEQTLETEPPEERSHRQRIQPGQEHTPFLFSGAIHNPPREDEQATRGIQRAGGLGREEYSFAKAEELTNSNGKTTPEGIEHPTRADPINGNHLAQEKPPEQIAARLTALAKEYIRIELSMLHTRHEAYKQSQEEQRRDSQAARLRNDAGNIKRLQQSIDEKTADLKNLGFFKFSEKKHLREEIKSISHSKEQAIATFQQEYKINPSQADHAIKAYSATHNNSNMISWKDRLSEINTGRNRQQAIELEYKREKILANIHPDSPKIQELISAVKNYTPGENMDARTARANAQKILNSAPTAEQYKKIIQEVEKQNPDKASKILDMARTQNTLQHTRNHPGRGGQER